MNERERQANRSLQLLDEAHRSGRLAQAEYRARRRALLAGLCDSDGVTARNALAPPAAAAPRAREDGRQRLAIHGGDIGAALFPDRHRLAWKAWLWAVGGLGLCALLIYGAMQWG